MKRKELLDRLAKFGRVDPEPMYVVVVSDLREPKLFKDKEVALTAAIDMARQRGLKQLAPSAQAKENGIIAQWYPPKPMNWPRVWLYESMVSLKWKEAPEDDDV